MLTPGFDSEDPFTWPSRKIEKKEDMPPVAIEVTPLEEASILLKEHFKTSTKTFMLSEPMTVTVSKADGSFSKRPMIGGESFRPVNCYVGKRKKLIFVFSPAQVSDFSQMEMIETEAVKAFGLAFMALVNAANGGEIKNILSDAKKAASAAAEAKKNEGKFKQYEQLGFGSW